VEVFLRTLFVIPVTSCGAERSSSSLRRLKTLLRSTVSQERLNSVAVCNIHQECIDALDLKPIVNEFVENNDRRLNLFEKLCCRRCAHNVQSAGDKAPQKNTIVRCRALENGNYTIYVITK
jgi:hypothetical protein